MEITSNVETAFVMDTQACKGIRSNINNVGIWSRVRVGDKEH